MSTTTNLNTLKINYLTQAQYDAAEQGGTINENELYLTPDTTITDVTVGGTSVVSDGVAVVPAIPTKTSDLTNDNGFVEGWYMSGDLSQINSIENSNSGIILGSIGPSAGNGVGIQMNPTTLSIGNETSSGGNFSISEKIGITNTGVVTITGLATPTNNTDAATKKYVDDSIPTVPVTDVTVNGTSVVSSGTAAITASQATYWVNGTGAGAVKTTGASKANGNYSVAEGYSTTASGNSSHAESYSTTASGNYSHAQNLSTIAQRKSQTALGEFNIADTGGTDTSTRGDYAVIVGNGTSSNSRNNALTIDWDGNVVASGNATTSDMSNTDIANFLASLNIRGACPYMVGDIYITTNSVNPETIWADTEWDRIEDTFLLSAGSTYTAGDTGGSADAIVPYHTHKFTDHWKTYKLNTTSRKPGTSTAVNYGTSITASDASGSYTTDAPSGTTSGNTVGANMPPYLVVNVWVRTA